MKETERPTKVTLEDLLQLKRTERPPAEFWPRFEQELRAKQLAAIVQTRPSWRNFAAGKTFIRLWVPLGAVAVVAMTFGSFRGVVTQPASSATAVGGTKDQRLALVQALSEANVRVVGTAENSESSIPVSQNVVTTVSVPQAGATEVLATGSTPMAGTRNEFSTGFLARTFVPGPVMQVLSEPTLVQMVGRALSVSSQAPAAREPLTEPLAQLATPRDNRRARLLAYSVTFDPHAADSSDAMRSRERITHRLSDEAIYDSITRLGLSGDHVSIKF